jgi:gag-polyprotein putative aspartyl protease
VDGAIAGPETSNVEAFDLREGFLIVVDGRIGPLEHLKFILDTGASHTVVSRKIADQLALSREPGSVIKFSEKTAHPMGSLSRGPTKWDLSRQPMRE